MSVAAPGMVNSPLDMEWERVELLGDCLLQARRGKAPEQSQLTRLEALQQSVQEARNDGSPWNALGMAELSPLEFDILSCVVAPEGRPRVGWLFQDLQAGTPQPYPTPTLLQDLLALEGTESAELYRALGEQAPLRRGKLIEVTEDGAFQPLRSASGVISRLLGHQAVSSAPPGSTRVRLQPDWDELVLPEKRMVMLREWLLRPPSPPAGEEGNLSRQPSGSGLKVRSASTRTPLPRRPPEV